MVEAFEQYWRKPPAIKRLVFRSLPDETRRAAALKSGEVDLAMLLTGPTAQDIRPTPGMCLVAPLLGMTASARAWTTSWPPPFPASTCRPTKT